MQAPRDENASHALAWSRLRDGLPNQPSDTHLASLTVRGDVKSRPASSPAAGSRTASRLVPLVAVQTQPGCRRSRTPTVGGRPITNRPHLPVRARTCAVWRGEGVKRCHVKEAVQAGVLISVQQAKVRRLPRPLATCLLRRSGERCSSLVTCGGAGGRRAHSAAGPNAGTLPCRPKPSPRGEHARTRPWRASTCGRGAPHVARAAARGGGRGRKIVARWPGSLGVSNDPPTSRRLKEPR